LKHVRLLPPQESNFDAITGRNTTVRECVLPSSARWAV
jgi:hypothetical protein